MTDNTNCGKKKSSALVGVIALLSVIMGVFRGVILFKYVDQVNGLYTNELVGNVFLSLSAVVILALIALYFPLKKSPVSSLYAETSLGNVSHKAMSVICILTLAAVAVSDAKALFAPEGFSVLLTLEMLFCLPCIAFFIMNFAKQKSTSATGVMAMTAVIFIALRTVICFIDVTTQINASERSLALLGLCVLMMYFLSISEVNVFADKAGENADAVLKRNAKYSVTRLLAVFAAISFFAPSVIYTAAVLKDVRGVVYGCMYLSLGVYALTRD